MKACQPGVSKGQWETVPHPPPVDFERSDLKGDNESILKSRSARFMSLLIGRVLMFINTLKFT